MAIRFQVDWISPPEEGIVPARIVEPQGFILKERPRISGYTIRDIEPAVSPADGSIEDDRFAFFLENESDVGRFGIGQTILLEGVETLRARAACDYQPCCRRYAASHRDNTTFWRV